VVDGRRQHLDGWIDADHRIRTAQQRARRKAGAGSDVLARAIRPQRRISSPTT
jgi:hypothetical protein